MKYRIIIPLDDLSRYWPQDSHLYITFVSNSLPLPYPAAPLQSLRIPFVRHISRCLLFASASHPCSDGLTMGDACDESDDEGCADEEGKDTEEDD